MIPAEQIQKIVEMEGKVCDGVLAIDVSRDDLGKVKGPLGVEFDGSFIVDRTLTFQPLGNNLAFFNGDIPLKPKAAQPFIDAIIANGLILQAFHQHYIEMTPNVWFIHWRGVGERLAIGSSSTRVLVSPEVTISTNIEFKPLGGSTAWAALDFAMTSSEVMKVVPFMRKLDWFNGCLYNQETAEAPQLVGDRDC